GGRSARGSSGWVWRVSVMVVSSVRGDEPLRRGARRRGGSAGQVREAGEVDGAGVARDEAEAALPLVPGLDLDAVGRGHSAGARDVLVVGEVGAAGVRVVVRRGRALDDRDDSDRVAIQVAVLGAVVGGRGADDLHVVVLVIWGPAGPGVALAVVTRCNQSTDSGDWRKGGGALFRSFLGRRAASAGGAPSDLALRDLAPE